MEIIFDEDNKCVYIKNRRYVWVEHKNSWDILDSIEYDFPAITWNDSLKILAFFMNFEY